jgi:hypothetical protein
MCYTLPWIRRKIREEFERNVQKSLFILKTKLLHLILLITDITSEETVKEKFFSLQFYVQTIFLDARFEVSGAVTI